MVVFPSESNVLAWHPVKSPGYVPGFVWISGILRKVGRSGNRGGSIDRRQQDQVPPRIIDLSAADGQSITVVVKPEPVVKHVAQKALLGTFRRIAGAADTTAMFTSHIASERERCLVQESFGIVVVLDLNAVVRVVAHAAGRVQGIFPQHVLIAENREP